MRDRKLIVTNDFTFPDGDDRIRRKGTSYQFAGLDIVYFTPHVSDDRYKVGIYYPLFPGLVPNSTNNTTTTIAAPTNNSTTTNYIYNNITQTTTNSLGQTIPVFFMSSGTTTYGSSSTLGTTTYGSSTLGTTTTNPSLPTWYMDYDGDGWHSYTQQKATPPGVFWKSSTNGLDCDDNDPRWGYACNPVRGWFLDNDGDGYFAAVQMSSTMPTAPGTWTDVITKGPDCDDTNPALTLCPTTPIGWFLDNDGDGWHASAQGGTSKPTTPGRWTSVMTKGLDCDDTNPYFTINCYTIGGSTQQQGSAYVPQANDKFAKPNIPTTMTKQILSTCATSGMEYLAKIFGKNTSRAIFEQYYYNQFGINLMFVGVDYSKMTIFANNFFETTSFVGITQAIDAGYFLMTNLDVGNNTYHNVVIVGYHPNGDYIYMDPIYGNLRESSPANFPNNYVVTIKKYK